MIHTVHIIICSIIIFICGAFSVNLTGYYEIDVETKLIRSLFFMAAIGCAILIGTMI